VLRGALCSLLLLLTIAEAARAQSSPADSPKVGLPVLLIIETQAVAIDPVVGRHVERALGGCAQSRGLEVLGPDEGRRVMTELALPYPPSLPDLWRATYRAGARYGVFAVASAREGRYRIALQLASRDGRGPFLAQGDATDGDFEPRVAELLGQALDQAAAPDASSIAEPAAVPRATAAMPAPTPPQPSQPKLHFFTDAQPSPMPTARAFRFAVHDDLAVGLAEDGFIADVIGARVDYRFGEATWLGAHLGYADLPGRHARVPGVLAYLQFEQRIAIVPGGPFSIPARLALGYLVRNGGVMRLSSGLAFALGERAELALDLLAPSFWITPSRTLFSLNFGLEVSVTL
jgi:hypothetical protein